MTNEIPWWALSPSPFTFLIWFLMAIWLMRKLYAYPYRRMQKINSFLDALFIVGFFTLIGDFFWCLFSLARFGWFYSFYPDVYQLLLCMARDTVGIIFCYLLTYHLWKARIISLNDYFKVALVATIFFFALWFAAANTYQDICWQSALSYGLPLETVVKNFVMSHIVGRMLLFSMIYGASKKPLTKKF
ncbi:MAG: hypothetical protein ACUVT9_05400 [Candidatus Bathycorpusculaceae bacterium]